MSIRARTMALCIAFIAAGSTLSDPHILQPPSYDCKKAVGAITVDGILDEESWKRADPINLSYPHMAAKSIQPPAGVARMCWEDTNLYIGIEIPDVNIQARGRERDAVGEESPNDLVEIFLDINGDDNHFFEFHVNPLGGFTDIFLVLGEPGSPLNERTTYDNIFIMREFNLKVYQLAVKVYGEVNKPQPPDEKWVVELALPFESLAMPYPESQKNWPPWEKYRKPHPDVGDVWRVQFAVQNYDLPKRYYVWAPTSAGFFAHNIQNFGRVRFVK